MLNTKELLNASPLEVTYEQDCSTAQSYINTKGLTIQIGGKLLVNHGDLLINRGTKYGLIGRNGHGKSTILKAIISGQIRSSVQPFGVDQTLINGDKTVFEEVVASDQDYVNFLLRKQQIASQIELAEQSADGTDGSSDDQHTAHQHLYEQQNRLEELAHERGFYKVEHRARQLLKGLGFEKTMDRHVNSFSGGWRMRIALSKVLFLEPQFLLLDEPTNHLDLGATIWLSNYLKQSRSTIILVTHNMDFLNNIVDHTIEIDQGRLKLYKGNYQYYKEQKQQEFDLQVKAFNRTKGKMTKREKRQRRPREVEVKIELETSNEDYKRLEIRLINIEFRYPGNLHLFQYDEFHCREGEKVVIIGENGSGKSTLLKIIRGDLQPDSGEICRDARIKFGYLSQNYEDILDYSLTPVQFINQFSPHMSEMEVRRLLSKCNLDSRLHHQLIETLSGGEKTRVIFSYISYLKPNFMIFDEPSNNLDLYTIDTLADLMNELHCGVILITHDTYLINSLDDHKLYVCHQDDTQPLSYIEEYDGYINDWCDEQLAEQSD